MSRVSVKCALVVAVLMLAGCNALHLVSPGTRAVAQQSFRVDTTLAWNRAQTTQRAPLVEQWTLNGFVLDSVSFVGGLPDGALLVQPASQAAARDNLRLRTAPSPSPEGMLQLVDRYYREFIGGKDFTLREASMTTFLGQEADQIDFAFTAADDAQRRGRAVWTIIDEKLYMMMVAGTDQHYFDAVLPEFTAMVASATMDRRGP